MTTDFISERLKEAREIRGLTMVDLANMLGISRQAISQIENGITTPSTKNLAELALVLKVPINYFTSPRPRKSRRTSPLFFRKFDSATKRTRKQAERYEEWLTDISDFLLNFLDFPKPFIPFVDKDFEQFVDDDIEQIALDVRTSWQLGKGAISNLVLLFQNNGILVTRINLNDQLDSFSCWREQSPIVILVSNKKTAVRSRFDAAHELAHLVLHRNIPDELLEDKKIHTLVEKQAHRFASAFLMPAESFSKDFIALSLPILLNLKRKWLVSISAMIMRGSDLGFINENQKFYIYKQLSAQGYRIKEPDDDKIAPEKPVLLERAFKMLIEHDIVKIEDVLDVLCLSVNDLKDIANIDYPLLNYKSNVVDINFKAIS